MKRRIVPVLLILISGAILFYLFFIQQEFKKTLHLKLPILAVTEQFTSPENLKKWFIPFVSTSTDKTDTAIETNKTITHGTYQLEVFNASIYSAILKLSNGKKNKEFLLSAIPDTATDGLTTINFFYKNSFLKEWFFPGELEKKAINSFNNFKEYLEDTKRVYGYEINPVKVVDTLFLFKRETVPVAEKRIATKSIFEKLIAFADKYNLGYNGNRIFYTQKGDDNITLFASIGISKETFISDNEEFEIKRMPFEKNLLEATYQGAFGESYKAFDALKNYLNDRNLSSIAIPYQKFISDGYDFADDQIVQMKIYYPVF